jgi:phosphohistidine phosphatase
MDLMQAGAVPFRRNGSAREFLLVTSHRGRWIFPKGIVEPGETPEETALKEAREEAGIRGVLLPQLLGEYLDHKWRNNCTVRMFLLEYLGECESWEEGGVRERRWCTYDDALRLIKKEEIRGILKTAWEWLEAQHGGPQAAPAVSG